MTRLSIIGLGWLGKPFAEHMQNLGHTVVGSTTSKEKANSLNQEGINTVLFSLNPHPEGIGFTALFDADVLIINIPPRTRSLPDTFHPEQVKYLKALAVQGGIKKIIYVSSTSIYPDLNQIARESDELDMDTTGNKALFRAEQILSKDKDYDLTIIRFGGLLGVDRIPGRYFSGKSNVDGDSPVNYIHRDDAVRLISWVIENDLWNQVFNGVAPKHPKRKQVYERNALELGFPPPTSYTVQSTSWKEISADKILATGFVFQMEDPLDFRYEKG
jgi:nucleoside-diphosphate-sugar epimerase